MRSDGIAGRRPSSEPCFLLSEPLEGFDVGRVCNAVG